MLPTSMLLLLALLWCYVNKDCDSAICKAVHSYASRPPCLVKSKGFAHLAALGLVAMMLRDVMVKASYQYCCVSRPYRDAQDRLLWRESSSDLSCTYQAHHAWESVLLNYLFYRYYYDYAKIASLHWNKCFPLSLGQTNSVSRQKVRTLPQEKQE